MNDKFELNLKEWLSKFTGIDEDRIEGDLERGLVAETIRIALYSIRADDESANAILLSIWVKRKIRSILPRINEKGGLYSDVLNEGTLNLVGIGEILKDKLGNYLPGNPMCLPITTKEYLLVSGTPSKYYSENGVDLKVKGSLRIIEKKDVDRLGIEIVNNEEFFQINRRLSIDDIIDSGWEDLNYLVGLQLLKTQVGNHFVRDNWQYCITEDGRLLRRREKPPNPKWDADMIIHQGKKILPTHDYQIKCIQADEYRMFRVQLSPPEVSIFKVGNEIEIRINDINQMELKRELLLALFIFGKIQSFDVFLIGNDAFDNLKEVLNELGIEVKKT